MASDRGPNIRIPPPTFFLAGFLAGLWLDGAVAMLPLTPWISAPALDATGIVLGIAGVGVGLWGAWTFRRAGAPVVPVRPTATLVTAGPYRFTRNPMYLGLALAYVGGALVLDTAWPLALLPLTVAVLHAAVIRREERYLAATFGAEYDAYRARVRRWI